MSLVNDALKRAQEQHANQSPRPPGTPPATPNTRVGPAPQGGRTWLLPVIAILLACSLAVAGILYLKSKNQLETATSANPMLALLTSFAKKFTQHRAPAPETNVNAEPAGPHIIIVTHTKTNVMTEQSPGKFQTQVPVPAAPEPEPTPAAAPVVAAAPAPYAPEKKASTNLVDDRSPTVLPEVAAKPAAPTAAPEAIKLQGILYSATRPAAILNGRTVFVGDRLGDLRVSAIMPKEVQLLHRSNTIVIKLP